ncbi:hypothetical protein [Floridanema evergladense]|uniref:Uncharacterized protein n=1 Tax=Floridaenema evergladense BLCC-F167 TaxID=3153639 RepID=A0ABV4WTK2_9CYAN
MFELKKKVRKKTQQPKVKSKVKIGKRWINDGEAKVRATPFEDECHLASMVQIELRGRKIGAYLLKKGENSFMLQFGFECQGIHTTLRSEQIDPIFDAIEASLKDLPENERLTINLGSFTSDAARQKELKMLYQSAPNTELQYLLMGERKRVQELTEMGIRKPKFLRLYGTYTVEPDTEGTTDLIEKALAKLERSWKQFTGELQQLQYIRIEKLIYSSFTDGFQIWEQLLANKMGLDIRPLTAVELWTHLWQRFNNTPTIPIPQLLVLDEDGLREDVYSEVHPVTLLMESPSSIPVADRRWVNVNSKYIGVLTFVDKPGGWVSKEQQLRYFWDNVMRREDLYDSEIFCQMMRANDTLVKTNMQRITKQSTVSAQLAKETTAAISSRYSCVPLGCYGKRNTPGNYGCKHYPSVGIGC